jgi:hypothetical protein
MIEIKTPQLIQAIFFYTLLSFLGSCSNDKTPITASTDPTINSAQLWLTNQIEQNDQMRSWHRAFSPQFEWGKAQLVVSPTQDSIIEIPYRTQQKYKYGIGPAGNKGEYGISKYIEAHATRMAISVHHNKYSARLMHLFADTMMLGDQKTFYPVDSLQKINFANSFQANPNFAVLIGYANFTAALKTLKYFELGELKMQGRTMSKYIAEEYPQRTECTQIEIMVVETPQWSAKGWGNGVDWDLPPVHEFMVSFGKCEIDYSDCKPSKESVESYKYYQRLAKKMPKGCDFVPDCCDKILAEILFQKPDELFPTQVMLSVDLCIDEVGAKKREPIVMIAYAKGNISIENQRIELIEQKKIGTCGVEFTYRIAVMVVRKIKGISEERKEVVKEVSFLFEGI